MNNQVNHTRNYRYNALLQAIDLFTQKFNISQLSNYAFEFTNDTLSLDSSALFIKVDNSFHLVKAKNYKFDEYCIADSPKLQRIATFYGNIMTSGFQNYFDDKDIQALEIKLVIPLIIKDLLYGFIVTNESSTGKMDEDDLLMCKALMQLINNGLESSKNFLDLQHTNNQLDQKIFNLFSINHSSRMLLSELDINKLYALAIDIFSELTSSRITSFGLYDEIKDKIVLRGYKDVYSAYQHQMDFELLNHFYRGYKVVFHYENDKELLQNIFKNYEDFKRMDAEYIILIVKDRVLGFVTISKPVNDRAYDQALFELIESLAASTYISFKNAIYFSEIDRQRKVNQQKLHTITNLNTLIRNINSCSTIEELCDIAIKTLHYGFGIKKVFIALKDKDCYTIKNHAGFELCHCTLDINHNLQSICSDSFVSYMADEAANYLSASLAEDIGASNCLVICPINKNTEYLDEEQTPLGYIVVLHAPQNLKEEEVMLIETMANSIAPVVNHLQEIKQIKKQYVPDQKEWFLNSLRTKLASRDKYYIDFYIYYRKMVQRPFEQLDFNCYNQYEHYYFDNMLLVISYEPIDCTDFDGSIEAADFEDAISKLKAAYISII